MSAVAWKKGAPIPEPRRTLVFSYCPSCERRFFNGSFWLLAYTMHYAVDHLGVPVLRDMQGGNR